MFGRKLLPLVSAALTMAVLSILLASWVSAQEAPLAPLASNAADVVVKVTTSATAHWDKVYNWTIDKSATPATWSLFKGDSGTTHYDITLTKSGPTDHPYVDGQVCVDNLRGDTSTQGLQISVALSHSSRGGWNVINSVDSLDLGNFAALGPGESHCYNYSLDVPADAFVADSQYKVAADVSITNHPGHPGEPFVAGGGNANTTMPASYTLVNDTVSVTDSNGSSWSFSDSGSQTYDKTFTCDTDAGTHDNTATITETGQKDSASVTVNCYALGVSKTADAAFNRTYKWTVSKSADQSSLILELGQSFLVNYTVTVNQASIPYVDGGWTATGTITVTNPTGAPSATINSVSDTLPGSTSGSVDCGAATFPFSLAAGGTLNCGYTKALPDAADRTNTGKATLQNHSITSGGTLSNSGTTDFSGTRAVSFSGVSPTEIDKTITVSDTLQGSLGTVTRGTDTLPKLFTYSRTIGPYSTYGDRTVENTASFTPTGSTAVSSSWTVNVSVPVPGCTLTLGYWKNHDGLGNGNQADMVTKLLPIWLGTSGGTKSVQVTTVSQADSIESMSWGSGSPSNGISKLYAQLLAAKLNIANGASDAGIASAISGVDGFLATHYNGDWSALSKPQQQQVLGWVTALDSYNNGITGPGHCSQ